MIFNINSTRGQTRFLTCVARVTCLVFANMLILEQLYALHKSIPNMMLHKWVKHS